MSDEQPRLQYRVRGYDPFLGKDEQRYYEHWDVWKDVPPEGLKSFSGVSGDKGSLYLSSIDIVRIHRQSDSFDLEVRIKPKFEPGFYLWTGTRLNPAKNEVRWMQSDPQNIGWTRVKVEEIDA